MRNTIGILVLGLLGTLSGCVSSMDRLFFNVQGEYDLSGNLPREEAAILEERSSNPFLTQSSCFFHAEDGDDSHNSRRLIVEPGVTHFELRCYVDNINGAASYEEVFKINTAAGHSYGAGIDGNSMGVTKQCLIVTDLTNSVEVARACGKPVFIGTKCGFWGEISQTC